MADCSEAINALVEAVEAIERELGVTPSAVYQNVRARLDILEARINNPYAPAPDVDNPFFIGTTGVTISVGDGYPSENRQPGSLYLRTDGYGGLGGLFTRGADGIWWQIDSGNGGGGGGGGSPTGPAGGDLTGTYPSPTVANNVITLAKFQQIATDSLLGRDTAGTGDVENITLNSTLVMNGSQVLGRAAISGDVTVSAGSNSATVTDLTITSEQQGSVLYFNGTNWVQLSPGTDGYVLTTHSTGQNPTWAAGGATYYGFTKKVYVPLLAGNAVNPNTVFATLGATEFTRSALTSGTLTIKFQVLLETTSPQANIKLYNYTTSSDVASSTLTTSSVTPTLLTSGDLYANFSSGSAIYQAQFSMNAGSTGDHVTCSMARLVLEWA